MNDFSFRINPLPYQDRAETKPVKNPICKFNSKIEEPFNKVLLSSDYAYRYFHSYPIHSFTPKIADTIAYFEKISNKLEKAIIISNYFEGLKKSNSKDRLYDFLKAFPKGGDTHCHLTGSIKIKEYLKLAQEKNLRFTLDYDEDKSPHFYFYKNGEVEEAKSLHASEISQDSALKKTFLKATTVDQEGHFFETFSNFESIEPHLSLSDYLFPLLLSACKANILYLEVSKGFESNFMNWDNDDLVRKYLNEFPENKAFESEEYLGKIKEKFSILSKVLIKEKKHYIEYIDKFYNAPVPTFLEKKGFENPFISLKNPVVVRINGDVNRETSLPQFFADLTLSFLMAQYELESYGKMARMLGVVISGREFIDKSLENLKAQLKMLSFLKTQFPKIRCSLHAGELSPKNAKNEAMRSALSRVLKYSKPDRIGHATCIEDDKKFEEILQKLTCIEICPTSSETILNIKGNDHPFKLLLKNKVPVTLNTDDAGVLRTNLSKEFIKAIRWHPGINYATIQNLARNQLRYSFLKGKEIYKDNAPYQYQLRTCIKNFDAEAELILASSPKAALQYRLEKSFLEIEKKYLPNDIHLTEISNNIFGGSALPKCRKNHLTTSVLNT